MVIESHYVGDGPAAKKEPIFMVIVICEEFKGPVSHLRCCTFENFFLRDLSGEKVF